MSLHRRVRRAFVAAVLGGCAAGLVGCAEPVPPVPDERLVQAVVALHLLEARAERTGDVGPADRAAALARLGLDTTAVRDALDGLMEEPAAYAALLRTVSARLDSLAALASSPSPGTGPSSPEHVLPSPDDTLTAAPGKPGLVRPGPPPGPPR